MQRIGNFENVLGTFKNLELVLMTKLFNGIKVT